MMIPIKGHRIHGDWYGVAEGDSVLTWANKIQVLVAKVRHLLISMNVERYSSKLQLPGPMKTRGYVAQEI
jgi:hypothetical protein